MVHVAAEMEREGFDIPLLIGGATTSRVHTAVKIHPHYTAGQTVYVTDASRAVGVVSSLLSPERKAGLRRDVRAEYQQGRRRACARRGRQAAAAARQGARQRASRSTGRPTRRRSRPSSARGSSTSYDLAELAPLHRLDAVLPDLGAEGPLSGDPRRREAGRRPRASSSTTRRRCCSRSSTENWFDAEGGHRLLAGQRRRRRHPALHRREPQRASSRPSSRCASSSRSATASRTSRSSDFVAPVESGKPDYVGGFVVTAGIEEVAIAERFERANDDYSLDPGQGARRPLRRGLRRAHARARAQGVLGLCAGREPRARAS